MVGKFDRPWLTSITEQPYDYTQPEMLSSSPTGYAPTIPSTYTSASPGLSQGSMDAISGGIGAAGQMTSVLAQLASQQAAMDAARKTAAAGTESNEKIAKMQLATDQENFSRRQRMAAYQAMIEASKRSIDTGSRSQASKGEALDVMSNVLARAMLRPKRRG